MRPVLEVLFSVFVAGCVGNLSYVSLRWWQSWKFEFLLPSLFVLLPIFVFSLGFYLWSGWLFCVVALIALGIGFKSHQRTSGYKSLIYPDLIVVIASTSVSLVLGVYCQPLLHQILKALVGFPTALNIKDIQNIYLFATLLAPNLAPLFFWLAQNTVHRSPLGHD